MRVPGTDLDTSIRTGLAYEAEARRRLSLARQDLAAAEAAISRFGPEQLVVNWRERCRERILDAIALCEEMGVTTQ